MMAPVTRRPAGFFRPFLAIALAAVTAAGDCSHSATDETILTVVSPSSRSDTTFVGDTLGWGDPIFRSSNGAIDGENVAWAVDQPGVAQLLDPTSYVAPGFAKTMHINVLTEGVAHLTFDAPGSHFLNNTPLTFHGTIVVVPRPTTLETPSQLTVKQGDSVTLTSTLPSGGSNVSRGMVTWTLPDNSIASFNSDGSSSSTEKPAPFSIRVFGRAIGHAVIAVHYTGPANLTFDRSVDVYVIPNTAHVSIEGGSTPIVTDGYESASMHASLIGGSGQPLDPNGIQFAARDPALVSIERATPCTGAFSPTACLATLRFDNAEIVRRGGQASTWIVASAGGVPPDSQLVQLVAGPESIEISPATKELAVGTTATYTLSAHDALGHALAPALLADAHVRFDQSGFAHASATIIATGTVTVTADSTPDVGTVTVHLTASRDVYKAGAVTSVTSTPAALTVRAVDHVTVTPSGVVLTVGDSHEFTATAFDGAGRSVTLPLDATWRVTPSSVATVDAVGTVSTQGAGTGTVFASILGVEGSTTFTVNALPPGGVPTGIVISPAAGHGAAGTQLTYKAWLIDDDGHKTLPAAGFAIGIQTDDTNVAQVVSSTLDVNTRIQTGVIQANHNGQTTVRAFYYNVSSGASTLAAPATIVVP